MKILVTNDDSIRSEGLRLLAEAAKDYGDTVIVAPLFEQSAQSHAINVRDGLKVAKTDLGIGVDAYTCDSTPADCVRTAYWGLKRDFDIVFSGINNGFNLGDDIVYSGTVAAVTEAALMNRKGIAFSADVGDCHSAAVLIAEIMKFFFENRLLELGNIYNVNIPKTPKGIRITKQGNTFFDTRFDLEYGLYYQRGNHRYYMDKDNNSDVWAVNNGYISITPLLYDRTDYDLYRRVNK